MDDYPAGDPIPDVDGGFRGQHNDLMEFLSNSREMRETARNSVKQAAFAGGESYFFSCVMLFLNMVLHVCGYAIS